MENQLTKRDAVALEFAKVFFESRLKRLASENFESFLKKQITTHLNDLILDVSFDFADQFLRVAERTKNNG